MEQECRQTGEDRKHLLRYLHIEELTPEAADTFIPNVWVYKDKRLEIEWNFRMDHGVSASEIR